jgi:hypothetical protein
MTKSSDFNLFPLFRNIFIKLFRIKFLFEKFFFYLKLKCNKVFLLGSVIFLQFYVKTIFDYCPKNKNSNIGS